jgi:hypothetical protein
LGLDYTPGEESLEAALFREQDIPWEHIAFRTVHNTLDHYYSDRRAGAFRLHMGSIYHRHR